MSKFLHSKTLHYNTNNIHITILVNSIIFILVCPRHWNHHMRSLRYTDSLVKLVQRSFSGRHNTLRTSDALEVSSGRHNIALIILHQNIIIGMHNTLQVKEDIINYILYLTGRFALCMLAEKFIIDL